MTITLHITELPDHTVRIAFDKSPNIGTTLEVRQAELLAGVIAGFLDSQQGMKTTQPFKMNKSVIGNG